MQLDSAIARARSQYPTGCKVLPPVPRAVPCSLDTSDALERWLAAMRVQVHKPIHVVNASGLSVAVHDVSCSHAALCGMHPLLRGSLGVGISVDGVGLSCTAAWNLTVSHHAVALGASGALSARVAAMDGGMGLALAMDPTTNFPDGT